MPRRKDGVETRDAILESAASQFARKGFRNTTNADIAEACGGVNSALISYYFGDKATLYQEAWEFAYRRAVEKYPPDGGVAPEAPASERLFGVIEADILRRSDNESALNGIMYGEIASPTGLLEKLYEDSLASLRGVLRPIVDELLGEAVSVEEKRLAVLSIFSMCIVPVEQIQTLEKNPQYVYDPEIRARHVWHFALAGLREIAERSNRERQENEMKENF